MNDNLEKELNEIESVEKQNQEHLKNIDSKVDELNELVNNINGKNVVANKNVGNNNNVVMNSNSTIQIQPQKEKTLIDVKKEIFDHRKLVRWTSFFGIFPIICFGMFWLFFWLHTYTNNLGNYYGNEQYIYLENSMYTYSSAFLNISITFVVLSMWLLVISKIFNIVMLCKLKSFRKLYMWFFIFSFIIPFLTWIYCMGLMSFMKHKNKINYYEWLKNKYIYKYNKKINHYIYCK